MNINNLLSASAAGWLKLIVTLGSQVLMTPLMLSFWSADDYGVWLLYLSIATLVQVIDMGHQNFVANKILIIGAKDIKILRNTISGYITGSVAFSFGSAAVFLPVIYFCLPMLNIEPKDAEGLFCVISFHLFVWCLTGNLSAALSRSTNIFGFYHRYAWIGLVSQLASQIFIVVAILCNFNYVQTAILMLSCVMVFNILIAIDAKNILVKNNVRISFGAICGVRDNLFGSFCLVFSGLMDVIRQHGSRVLLTFYVSPVNLATVSSMRTIANIANQGVLSFMTPLSIEFMAMVRNNNSEKVFRIFCLIWFVIVSFVCPLVLLLGVFAEDVFVSWTRGKLVYDQIVFYFIVSSVVVAIVAQPASLLMQSANLLRWQVFASFISAVSLLLLMYFFVPYFGIKGFAFSLFFSELIFCITAVTSSILWLCKRSVSINKSIVYLVAAIIILYMSIGLLLLYKVIFWKMLIAFNFAIILFLIAKIWGEFSFYEKNVIKKILKI